MKATLSIILFIFFFTSCKDLPEEPTHEQESFDGYYFDFCAFSSELPQSLVDTSSSFKIKIRRETFHDEWKILIEKAEACFPPKNKILESYFFTEPDSVHEESLWWCDIFDGIRIPYCITGSSVAYYTELIKSFQSGDFSGAGIFVFQSASVEYEASVTFYESIILGTESYTEVYIVKQKLKWNDYCGNMCALITLIERLVIFEKNGYKLLGVIGDGYPMVIVS
jgi:hypothetical protein